MHCYSLAFQLVFACRELDDCNWRMDFGGLKPVRALLYEMFDQTVLVGEDDPLVQSTISPCWPEASRRARPESPKVAHPLLCIQVGSLDTAITGDPGDIRQKVRPFFTLTNRGCYVGST
jgi:hypothetical protein